MICWFFLKKKFWRFWGVWASFGFFCLFVNKRQTKQNKTKKKHPHTYNINIIFIPFLQYWPRLEYLRPQSALTNVSEQALAIAAIAICNVHERAPRLGVGEFLTEQLALLETSAPHTESRAAHGTSAVQNHPPATTQIGFELDFDKDGSWEGVSKAYRFNKGGKRSKQVGRIKHEVERDLARRVVLTHSTCRFFVFLLCGGLCRLFVGLLLFRGRRRRPTLRKQQQCRCFCLCCLCSAPWCCALQRSTRARWSAFSLSQPSQASLRCATNTHSLLTTTKQTILAQCCNRTALRTWLRRTSSLSKQVVHVQLLCTTTPASRSSSTTMKTWTEFCFQVTNIVN